MSFFFLSFFLLQGLGNTTLALRKRTIRIAGFQCVYVSALFLNNDYNPLDALLALFFTRISLGRLADGVIRPESPNEAVQFEQARPRDLKNENKMHVQPHDRLGKKDESRDLARSLKPGTRIYIPSSLV